MWQPPDACPIDGWFYPPTLVTGVGPASELAQVEIFTNPGKYQKKVYTLPKTLDEKVAALHLEKVGAKLTKLRADQAKYIGVPEAGPFKAEQYRY